MLNDISGVIVILIAAVLVSSLCVLALIAHKRKTAKERLRAAARDAELSRIKTEIESSALERIAETERKFDEKRDALEELEKEIVRQSRETDARAEKIRAAEKNLEEKISELADARERYEEKIRDVARISPAQARADILKIAAEKATDEARRIRREILEHSEEEFAADARRLIITTMQRIAPRLNEEQSSVLVPIPAEEIKGRLIGREGRNIKCFEQTTGTTLIIDDTPGSVLVSCFDPFRRHVAAIALRRLIDDGRIHPQSIENYVADSERDVVAASIEIGTTTCDELGVFNVPENVRELLGKLQFRLSVSQNTLAHSIETARLAGTFAAELGLDPEIAKRAGLFHDIGKAIDAENEDAHAIAGARVLRQAGEERIVVNAVEAHHREVGHESVYGPLVMLADSLSATRPGARTSTHDGYAERIQSLEEIARRFPGVSEAYAIQAGREVRVIVASEEVDDVEARAIALKIRMAIEDELTYPGKIRVVVIREFRVLEEAL